MKKWQKICTLVLNKRCFILQKGDEKRMLVLWRCKILLRNTNFSCFGLIKKKQTNNNKRKKTSHRMPKVIHVYHISYHYGRKRQWQIFWQTRNAEEKVMLNRLGVKPSASAAFLKEMQCKPSAHKTQASNTGDLSEWSELVTEARRDVHKLPYRMWDTTSTLQVSILH